VRTISVISRKGGTGKTTISMHLAIRNHLAGQSVMLADIDPQLSSIESLKMRSVAGPTGSASSGPKLFTLQTAARKAGVETLVIDTPPGREDDILPAISLSDLAVMVVRPTFLDLKAAALTARMIQQLQRPGLIVLNQTPACDDGVEQLQVKNALEALALLNLPIAPHYIRTRVEYQDALAAGCSVEELDANGAAADEVREVSAYIDRFMTVRSRNPLRAFA
jgi:chromosome partitioning protein